MSRCLPCLYFGGLLGVELVEACMAPKWSERPKADRWMIVGLIIGGAVGVFLTVNEENFLIRFLFIAAGAAIGAGIAKFASSRTGG
jgi:hypothetical protein